MNITEKIDKYLNEKKETRMEAMKKDKNKNGKIEVYIEEDDYGTPTIFGINSGFAYASPSNPKKWIKNNSEFVLI